MGKYASAKAFRADCEKHFAFLVDTFGFELVPEVFEFTVTFLNATTIVSIEAGGYGTRVGVGLGRVERDRYEGAVYPFDKLLLIRQRDLALIGPGGYPTNHDQEFQVQHYAKALLEHGTDVLRGDFGIWPELRKKAWPRKRAAKKKVSKRAAKKKK